MLVWWRLKGRVTLATHQAAELSSTRSGDWKRAYTTLYCSPLWYDVDALGWGPGTRYAA